nr:MAG: replication associated protein [Cressdnaviricota sp.]
MSLQFSVTDPQTTSDSVPDDDIGAVLNPTSPKGKFHIWARYYILTYRTHLNKSNVIDLFTRNFQCTIVRVAHETSTKQVQYEHTHVFLDFGKQFNSQNCRIFDLGNLHPNIGPISKRRHLDRVYRYMCKQDHSNDDMKGWAENSGVCVQDVWEHPSLQEAVKRADKITDVPGIIAAYNLKPQAEPKVTPWEFEWQYELELRMATTTQPRRQIWWYYDRVGGLGKTDFVKGMLDRYPADTYVFTQFGGAKDAATVIVNAKNTGWTGKYCLIDLPRDAEAKCIYEPMEMIRNGLITSIKYSGSTVRFNSVWVVVFANFMPEIGHMSPDRWVVYQMNEFPKFKVRCNDVSRVVDKASEAYFSSSSELPPFSSLLCSEEMEPETCSSTLTLGEKLTHLQALAAKESSLVNTSIRSRK